MDVWQPAQVDSSLHFRVLQHIAVAFPQFFDLNVR